MARRRRVADVEPAPATDAERGYIRFKAAQVAFVMTGGMPDDWFDDRWWSRWETESSRLWVARDWTPLGDLYRKALKRKGAAALKTYEVHLRRYERQLELNPGMYARLATSERTD